MRDPKRIDKFINELRGVWHQHPDMRFSQLLINVLDPIRCRTGRDPYYMEDDELIALIKKAYLGEESE